MSKTTLIHIGLHKTGTTWLQNELFTPENKVFIPLYSRDTLRGHSTLAEDFIFDIDRDLLSSFDDNRDVIVNNLKTIISTKESSDKVFVMSHERLSGYPSSSGFDGSIIANRIKKIFPNGKILIVIREQVSCILSNYFQYLKEGGTKNIMNYLNGSYDGRIPGFSINYFRYHHIISFYQNLFGSENTLVLTYELFKNDKAKFIENIGDFLNENIYLEPKTFNKIYNIKNHYYIDYKLRYLNKFIYSSSSLNSKTRLRFYFLKLLAIKIKGLFYFFSSKKLNNQIKEKLTQEIEQWTNGRFNESNKISSELMNTDLAELGYKVSN